MKKIITLLTIVSSILFLSLPVSALDQKKEIIKLDNGYYLETIIEEPWQEQLIKKLQEKLQITKMLKVQ